MSKAGLRKHTYAAQACDAKPAKKFKLIEDFSEEFQEVSQFPKCLQTSKAAPTKQDKLLHLIVCLDHARASEQHHQCQSLCSQIRAILASSLQEKIVGRLAALLSSVCPLLTSTVTATHEAASVILHTIAVKVPPKVLLQHSEHLAKHLITALGSGADILLNNLDLLQSFLMSVPRLLEHSQLCLLPSLLELLMPQTDQKRTAVNQKLASLCSAGDSELERYKDWLACLSSGTNTISDAQAASLETRASLLDVLVRLVHLDLSSRERQDQDTKKGGLSLLWLRATAVVVCSGATEQLLDSTNVGDDASQQLIGSQLRLLQLLHSSLPCQEWLACTVEPSLRLLHRLLLPPPPASVGLPEITTTTTPANAATATIWPLLELRVSLVVVSCCCRLYRPSSMRLLTQALQDILPQLEQAGAVDSEVGSLYKVLLLNTFAWLQGAPFQHSGQLLTEMDLTKGSALGGNGMDQLSANNDSHVDRLSASDVSRADQLLADALENPLVRKSSVWSNRVLSETLLIKKLLRHDVKSLVSTEYQALIEPVVTSVFTDLHEDKNKRVSSLDDWSTEGQKLTDQLLESLSRCGALANPDTTCCHPLLGPPFLALLLCPSNDIGSEKPRRLWWNSLMKRLQAAPAGELQPTPALGRLVEVLRNRYCFALSSTAALHPSNATQSSGGR